MHDTATLRARWAVAAMFFANGLMIGAWAPQVPLLLPRHGITEATLGLLILGLGAGAVGAMLFCGRLIARFGSRRVTAWCGLAMVPTLPLVVIAPSIPLLAIAMALFGALIGSMDVGMNANAVAVERRLARAIMSSSHGFWSLGGFAGAAAGGVFIDRAGSLGQALAASGLALACIIAALPFLLSDPGQGRAGAARPPALLPRDPAVWILGAMALCCMVPEGAVLDWSALYLRQELGATVATSGLAFAGFSATMAGMRFVGDALRNRLGAVRTLRTSGIAGAVGLALGALAPTDVLAVAGFAVAGIGVANMVPILFSAAGNARGMSAGTGLATVTMLGYSGILVAPSAIGFIAEPAGFRAIFLGIAVLLLVVSALAPRAVMADARLPG